MFLRKGQAETKTDKLDNGLFTVLLVGAGVLGLSLTVRMYLKPDSPMVSRDDWVFSVGFCVLAGLIATLFGRLALFAAIARIGATRGVIINTMAPLVTLAIAVMVLGEKFSLFDIFGMTLLVVAMALLLIERVWFLSRSLSMLFQQGVVAAILATLFQGIGYTFRKVGIDTSITALFAATLDTLSALVVYILLLGVFGRLKTVVGISLKNVSPYTIAAGLLSATAVLLFFSASDAIPVSQVSVITGIQPVIVALLSSLFMKNLERLSWVTFICAFLATLGVAVIAL